MIESGKENSTVLDEAENVDPNDVSEDYTDLVFNGEKFVVA
jgi:hypothetical protein